MHGYFEAIPKINMNNLPCASLKKDIGRMPVPKAKNMANHAIHGEGASVTCPTFQPMLGIVTLEP